MADPFRPRESIKETIEHVENFDFKKEVYPNAVMKVIMEAIKKKKNLKPPKTIFIPS
jgi:hypothetical protein